MRYRPPPPAGLPVALPRPFSDTLFLSEDGNGLWSVEIEGDGQNPSSRVTTLIALEPEGLLLFLNLTPCAVCRSAQVADERGAEVTSPRGNFLPDAPRRTSVIPRPHFRILRHGLNRFELQSVATPDVRQYYVRAPTT